MTNRMRVATSGRPAFADDYAVTGVPGNVLTRVAGPTGAPDDVEWHPSTGGPPAPATSHILFVSSVFGSDVTGNGSMGAPFATIAHAQSQVVAATFVAPWEIVVFPGTYLENVVLLPFTRLVAWDSSKFDNIPLTQIQGNVTLSPTFNAVNANANVTNIQLAGDVTIDFPGVSGPTGEVSLTGCDVHGNVAVTGDSGNKVDFYECTIAAGDFNQVGGIVRWFNTSGTPTATNLVVKPRALHTALFEAHGGSWPGNVHADQDTFTTSLTLDLSGFSAGPLRMTAAAAVNPVVIAPYGAFPENPTLDGSAAAALSAQLRVSLSLSVPTNTLIEGLSSTDVLIPLSSSVLGATSIETMACGFSPLGPLWNTELGNLQLSWAFYVRQNGATSEVHVVIYNPGAGDVTTTAALPLIFSGYVPS